VLVVTPLEKTCLPEAADPVTTALLDAESKKLFLSISPIFFCYIWMMPWKLVKARDADNWSDLVRLWLGALASGCF
jgi:hypothetical protein